MSSPATTPEKPQEDTAVKLSTSDIVKIIFGYSERPPNGATWRIIPIQAIHTALFNIKGGFPELLKQLRFSEHSIEPHSLGIESALASFYAAEIAGTGLFARKALLLMPEKMRQALRKHIENDYPDPEASEQFEALAQAFDQEVAKFESENPL